MRFVFVALLALACDASNTDTGFEEPPFCVDLADGGKTVLAEGSEASSGSGTLSLRVITDQSDDPFDPLYVAYRDFALEPADVGGVQTTGQTNGDGLVSETLGAGSWNFEATWSRGSTVCTAELGDIAVESGQTTSACVVLTCPL